MPVPFFLSGRRPSLCNVTYLCLGFVCRNSLASSSSHRCRAHLSISLSLRLGLCRSYIHTCVFAACLLRSDTSDAIQQSTILVLLFVLVEIILLAPSYDSIAPMAAGFALMILVAAVRIVFGHFF